MYAFKSLKPQKARQPGVLQYCEAIISASVRLQISYIHCFFPFLFNREFGTRLVSVCFRLKEHPWSFDPTWCSCWYIITYDDNSWRSMNGSGQGGVVVLIIIKSYVGVETFCAPFTVITWKSHACFTWLSCQWIRHMVLCFIHLEDRSVWCLYAKGTELWRLKWYVRYQCLLQDSAINRCTVIVPNPRGKEAWRLSLEWNFLCRCWNRNGHEAILFFWC